MPDVMKTVGRYEILRELGRGGMALVFLARQTDLDRFVALKELGAFHASDPSFAQRFVRESRVAGSLSHPNVVTVHDYFEHEGTPYIAMEYVERGSLRPYIGKMTLAQIGGVLEGLLAGLTHGEQNGIVHRDLKPENLMVTADGRVKIADFGIAKATTKMQTGAFLTATGTTVGTPTYMAPEQAMAQDIGPWTDLYSVGCMAFEMFTGRVPFHDSDAPMAILLRHVNEPIAPVKSIDPNVDERISDWVERMLVKDPKQRTQSAADAWDDFEEIIIGLLGPRWRREARLVSRAQAADTPGPLTPAPFEGTEVGDGGSDEFQSFAWGTPGADTGAAPAATPGPYTPPPQDLPPGPITPPPAEAAPGPATPPPVPAAEAPAAAPVTPPPSEAIDSGFVTFGAPAPAPPTDALVPPADAPPAEPPVTPPPSEAVAPPPAEAPPAEEEQAEESGFETYIAPPPLRPPTEDPGTDALSVPAPPAAEPAPPPAAEPAPPPVPEAAPPPVPEAAPPPPPPEPEPEPEPPRVPEPEPVASTAPPETGGAETVMPSALPKTFPDEAPPKPKREKKPKAAKPPKPAKPAKPPKPAKPAAVPDRGVAERAPSRAFPIAVGVAALLALIVGFLAGGSGGGGGTAGGAATVATTGGDVALKVPEGWSRVGSPPDVPGLSLAKPVAYAPGGRDGGQGVLFGVVKDAADNSTLLAAPFLQALGGVPKRGGAVRIGSDDLQAYRYDNLKPSGFDRAVTVYAVPTTAGVATLACLAPAASSAAFKADCDGIANTLGLTGGDPFPVGPSKAYADAVGKALGDVGAARKSGQAKLSSAKKPADQGAAARSISGAYDKAAKSLAGLELSPADRGANTRLVKALEGAAAGYAKAASAAAKKDKAGFAKAGKTIATAEKEVAGALAGLKAAGYGVAS